MADVGQLVGLHWKLVHGDQTEDCSYNALSCKQSLEPPSLLSPKQGYQTEDCSNNAVSSEESALLSPKPVPNTPAASREESMDASATKMSDPKAEEKCEDDIEEVCANIKEEVLDPIQFSGPFQCRFSSCQQILDDAQAVFRHCDEQHAGFSIQKMKVMHIESGTTFPNIGLYKYVFECNFGKCRWFTYRNSSLEDAEALLKNHWKR